MNKSIFFTVSGLALLAFPSFAQVYTTTCLPSITTCSITVASGTVTVSNPNPAPAISITQPVNGASLAKITPVIATYSTGVASVAFFIDGLTSLGQSSANPAMVALDTTKYTDGAHTLTARATQGTVQITSAPVSITIKNSAPPVAGPPVTDKFTTTTLNTALWSFINPVGDGTYSATTTGLKLTAPAGKNHDPAFGGADNAVRIRQPISNADFSVVTRFDSIPAQQYQFEGIVVEQDAMNYLRLQFGSSGSGNLVANADILLAGVESTGPTVNLTPGAAKSLWLGVSRAGDVWTLGYSTDGTAFTIVGTFTQALISRYIGPFAGNYGTTSAPAFAATVNIFANMPMPTPVPPPPPVSSCSATPTGVINVAAGSNVANAISSAAAGNNVIFGAGAHSIPARMQAKAGVAYCGPATGTATLQGNGGYAIWGLAANGVTMSGLTMKGGGVEINGSADKFTFTNNVIRDILIAGDYNPGVTAIFQDPAVGQQLSNSTIDHNQFLNIYGPGELTCSGQFPSNGGQPCDYSHMGMELYNVSNVGITYNTFDTISSDAIHAFEPISCGETGGGRVAQPNINISHNLITNTYRVPIEMQLCGMVNPILEGNVITRTYIPNAWDLAISFASEATGARITNNYIDGSSSQGPSWGIPGVCIETGGTGTVVDNNYCSNATGSSGYVYYGHLASVMGSSEQFTNNHLCGPFPLASLVVWEPPCLTGSCSAFSSTNNTVAASCSGFPAAPAAGASVPAAKRTVMRGPFKRTRQVPAKRK